MVKWFKMIKDLERETYNHFLRTSSHNSDIVSECF